MHRADAGEMLGVQESFLASPIVSKRLRKRWSVHRADAGKMLGGQESFLIRPGQRQVRQAG